MKLLKSVSLKFYLWPRDKIITGLRRRFEVVEQLSDTEFREATYLRVCDFDGFQFLLVLWAINPSRRDEIRELIFDVRIKANANESTLEVIRQDLKMSRISFDENGNIRLNAQIAFTTKFKPIELDRVLDQWLWDVELVMVRLNEIKPASETFHARADQLPSSNLIIIDADEPRSNIIRFGAQNQMGLFGIHNIRRQKRSFISRR